MPEVPLQQSKATRREWIGLAVIALPCVLYAMDLTVLNIAVPRMSEDLKPTSSQLLWILMTSIVNALLMLATAVAATLMLRQGESVHAG